MAATGNEPWFHGRITRVLAEARLENTDVGTFLFRESESRPGYSLSLKVPDKIKHFMVSQQGPDTFSLVGKPNDFGSMAALVEFYHFNPTSSQDGVCLKFPCAAGRPTEEEEELDENPYVDLLENDTVNEDVLKEVEEMSRKKSAALPAPTSPASRKLSKKHSYENFEFPMKK